MLLVTFYIGHMSGTKKTVTKFKTWNITTRFQVHKLKGQSHEIFDLWVFHQTITLGSLIHGLRQFQIDSFLRRYSIIYTTKIDSLLCYITWCGVNFILLENPLLLILFYSPEIDKLTYGCFCSKGCCKSRNISTPCCAKNSALHNIAQSSNSWLCNSVWNPSQKFSFWLRAKSTSCYAT
jgi:hypothetical protein